MMCVAVSAASSLGYLLCLMCCTFVHSAVAPPCTSQLGLNSDGSHKSLFFDIAVSSGDAETIRLNGAKAWTPVNVSESFIEINASDPILLTGLQVQGDIASPGQITGWSLETSLDCENYHAQNYIRDSVPAQTETVLLKHIEFVLCIRLRPTHWKGETPALRLELLGCEINDDSRCGRGVYPVTEIWMNDGSRQLNFDHDVVLVWVKVLLEQKLKLDKNVSISYSRSCLQREYYNLSEMNIVSVASSNHRKRWLTIEIEQPVKVKCLIITPPLEATLREIHTSACNSHLPSSLLMVGTDLNEMSNEKDAVSTVQLATEENKPELQSTSFFSLNGLPLLSTDSTTVSNVKEWSTKNNSSTNEVDLSQNNSKTNNSSTFTYGLLMDRPNPSDKNTSSENTSMISLHKGIETTKEEQATIYNTTVRETQCNNFTVQTSTTDSNSLNVEDSSSHNVVDSSSFNGVENSSLSDVNSSSLNGADSSSLNARDNSSHNVDTNPHIVVDNSSLNGTDSNSFNGVDNSSLSDVASSSHNGTDSNSLKDVNSNSLNGVNNNSLNGVDSNSLNGVNNNSLNGVDSNALNGVNNSSLNGVDSNSLNGVNSNSFNVVNSNSLNGVVSNSLNVEDSSSHNLDSNPHNVVDNSPHHFVDNRSLNFEDSSFFNVEDNKTSLNVENNDSLNVADNNSQNVADNNSGIAVDNSFFNFVESISNSLNNSDEDRIVNMSTSTSSESSESVLQPNISSTTGSLGVDILTAIEQATSALPKKDDNKTQCGVKNMAKGNRRKRVVGGKMNNPGEWPWLVSMHFLIEFEFTRMSGFKHTCGASLVAPRWVITAAHCFSDALLPGLSNMTLWRVYLGMHDLAKAESDPYVQERIIEDIYIHEEYDIINEPLLNDLALVKLNESVDVNDRVSPVCLDDETELNKVKRPCFVSGWGKVTVETPGSRFPYTASLSTMTKGNCSKMYNDLPDSNEVKQYARINDSVLCAAVGDNGEDACQGDSGGPLMCEHGGIWYQAGIVAGGYLCGHKATPGLYTRIANYSSWIRDTMEHNDD